MARGVMGFLGWAEDGTEEGEVFLGVWCPGRHA